MSDHTQIRSLVEQLDAVIPREGGVMVLTHPDECDNTLVRASKLGYLRLGLELMKAAYVPSRRENGRDMVEVELGYLTGLEQHCYSFERSEEIAESEPAESSGGGFGAVVGFAVVGLILACLLVGAVTIVKWVGSLVL